MTSQNAQPTPPWLRAGTCRGQIHQRGVALAQGLISATLIGSMGMVGMDWAVKQAGIDRERSQAQALLLINSAAGNYLSRFHDQLVALKPDKTDALPAECATVSFKVGTSAAVPTLIRNGGCQATLVLTRRSDGTPETSYTVKNALQPTLSELKAMGILGSGVSETPLLPVTNQVAGPAESGEASSQIAPNTYAVVLYPRCNGAGTSGLPATPCLLERKAFTSLVFNIQPFEQGTATSQNFSSLLSGLGPDGAISGPIDSGVTDPEKRVNPNGELRALGRGWTMVNPIVQDWSYSKNGSTMAYVRGADGIAALRNGFDAATALEYTRRDGSSPPTANWDFNGKSITNVDKLQVVGGIAGKDGTLQIAGNQTVTGNQDVTGDLTVTGNQDVTGNLTVGKAGSGGGAATGVLTALADMIVKGATELQGKLTVAGTALFKGEVTFEQLVRAKDIALTGQLSATSAVVSGDIQSGTLHIGSTAITADGTLLGAQGGWGVDTNAACAAGAEYALAQSKTGQLMICRSSSWQPLINRENTVTSASGAGNSCSPNGAAGRLPDGTLAICTNGQWQSAAQGNVTAWGGCSIKGAIATSIQSGDYLDTEKYVTVVCNGAYWIPAIYSRPLPQYGSQGRDCALNREVTLEGRLDPANPALLGCVNGSFADLRQLKTTLPAGQWMGESCSPNGTFALDTYGTGMLVCAGGVWSKPTEALSLGSPCTQEHNSMITTPGGMRLWCAYGKWQDFPDYIDLTRNSDGVWVRMIRGVKKPGTGEVFYLYSEPNLGPLGASQTMYNIRDWYCRIVNPIIGCTDDDNSRSYLFRYNYSIVISLPSTQEAYALSDAFGGLPPLWSGAVNGGPEFWVRTATGDKAVDWHVTVNLSNKNTNDRWSIDQRAVAFRVTGY